MMTEPVGTASARIERRLQRTQLALTGAATFGLIASGVVFDVSKTWKSAIGVALITVATWGALWLIYRRAMLRFHPLPGTIFVAPWFLSTEGTFKGEHAFRKLGSLAAVAAGVALAYTHVFAPARFTASAIIITIPNWLAISDCVKRIREH